MTISRCRINFDFSYRPLNGLKIRVYNILNMGTSNQSPKSCDRTMKDASGGHEDYVSFNDNTIAQDPGHSLHFQSTNDSQVYGLNHLSLSQTREREHRINDEIAMLQAERVVSNSRNALRLSHSLDKSRSRRTEHIDEFDVNTNPVHEINAVYKPPEHPASELPKIFKKIHNSSFLVRYFMYIIPVAALLLVPLLVGALVYENSDKGVGGVELLWFSVWLEIVWLTLWAGRVGLSMLLGEKQNSRPADCRKNDTMASWPPLKLVHEQ